MTHQFNIDAIPLDAYLQLWQNMPGNTYRNQLINLNFGWYYDHDDTIYDDRITARQKLVSGYRAYTGWHRDLHHIRDQTSATDRKIFDASYSAIIGSQLDSRAGTFIQNLDALYTLEEHYRKSHTQFGDIQLKNQVPSYDRFKVENLGSWGQQVIRQALEPATVILRDGMAILHKYRESTGAIFQLKHPIAMGSPVSFDDLYRSPGPITASMGFVLGSTRNLIMATINKIEPSLWWGEDIPRVSFERWARLNATATFTWEQPERQHLMYALTPAYMPSVLLMPSHNVLPLTLEYDPTPSLEDGWQWIQKMTQQQIFDGKPENRSEAPYVHFHIQRLGWLIAMAASIISMNVRVGHGHHRITWIHSVLNAAHVGQAMMLAPMILHVAREAAND